MSLLTFEKSIVDKHQNKMKQGDKLIIRRQQCMGCKHVLALEITDKMGYGGEYYVAKDCAWLKGEPQIMYDKERWFGNHIRCPVCGLEGKLPMDIPLNWDTMQKREEIQNAVHN